MTPSFEMGRARSKRLDEAHAALQEDDSKEARTVRPRQILLESSDPVEPDFGVTNAAESRPYIGLTERRENLLLIHGKNHVTLPDRLSDAHGRFRVRVQIL
jgi:hypothetical protein